MLSLLKNKYVIGGIILTLYLGYIHYKLYDYTVIVGENKEEILKLTNENTKLSESLENNTKVIEMKDSVISDLQDKNNVISESLENEVNVWKRKYSYCINNKNKTMPVNGNEVMNNEASKFYIDVYNSDIFN